MKLTKTSALAALAMAYLATQNQDLPIQARQVADHLNIPTDSALKILQCLSRHRLILSQLGRGGGYRLAGSADQVSLLEIVEAIDGPIEAELPLYSPGSQDGRGLDTLQSVCQQVAEHARRELASISVAHLARTSDPVSSHALSA